MTRKLLLTLLTAATVAIATHATAEHGEDGTYNLAVLLANQSAAKS